MRSITDSLQSLFAIEDVLPFRINFLFPQRSHLPQEYAKPTRLLPARDLRSLGDESPDKIISLLQSDGSQSLYKVLLRTSSCFGSDLSDSSAAILICIIDEYGNSILERIPAVICQDHILQSKDSAASDHVHFQRGSVDGFILRGPKLERIQAMWISLESGSWRLGGARLTTINASNHQTEKATEKGNNYHSITYKFVAEEILLGEGSDMSMTELRPHEVTEYSGVNPPSIFDKDDIQAVTLSEKRISNEESMREYSALKYSLLLYDSILIYTGTSILLVTGADGTAVAFFTGGVTGFLYLLLLQRSVDTLPTPESVIRNDSTRFGSLFGKVKGPVIVLAFAFVIIVLALNHGRQDVEVVLGAREIIVAMLGFLACKLSVVLAAFKPLSIGMEDK